MEDVYTALDVQRILVKIEYEEDSDMKSKKESMAGSKIQIVHENDLIDTIKINGGEHLIDMVEADEYTPVKSDSPFRTLNKKGEHNPDYPGNWKQFKKQVIKRDMNECQNCGDTGVKVDPIVPTTNRGNFVKSNYVTLCEECYQNKNQETDSTTSDYPNNWDTIRREVYKQNNYQCQNCGMEGGKGSLGEAVLNAHHIVPRSKGGNDKLSNLVALCDPCHNACHEHL